VLGWDVQAQDMGGGMTYHLLKRPGSEQNMGGVMTMEGPMWAGIQPHWMVYMAVDDVERSKTAVEQNGGQVKYGPFDAPGVGKMIVCADPQGAVFTLIQPAPEMKGG